MNHGPCFLGKPILDSFAFHQLAVSCKNLLAADNSLNAVTCYFAYIVNLRFIDFRASPRLIFLCQRNRNRVGGVCLGVCRKSEKLIRSQISRRLYALHLENAFGKGSGLVHNHKLGMCRRFQIIAAFNQQTDFRGGADPAEKAKRHRNYQRTWAGNYEEVQRPVNPVFEQGSRKSPGTSHEPASDENRRNERQGDRRAYYRRRVDRSKSGDEIFHPSLLAAGVFYKLQNLAYRGFSEGFCYFYFQQTAFVNAAAEDFVSLANAPRNGFSGKRRRVQPRLPADDDTVQRNLFSRFYHDHIADFYLIGVNLFRVAAIKQDIRIVRANVHKLRDGLSGFSYRIVLEKLANLIEKHNRHRLRELACCKGSK